MEKHIYNGNNGLWYELQGDYYIPCLTLGEEDKHPMSLWEIDKIIYPVCKLCRDHEKAGFMEGVKIGIKLSKELDI